MVKYFPDHFEDESKYCKALFIKKYPSSLSDRFINEITSLPVHSITSIDVVPVPKDLTTKVLQKKYLGIESDMIKQQLWKKVRKQGGFCTGITQNVVDLLQNYTATTMLANSEFVALLKQANTDSSKMAEVIGVSEAQLRFVTNTASGMGLIKCGSVVIPFDNQISKDTDLYKLYNTNIHEKIAEQKKKEAMLQ